MAASSPLGSPRRLSANARAANGEKRREIDEASKPRLEALAKELAEVGEEASATGVPVAKLLKGETAKLVHMEERLHQRVVGQEEAIEPA